jgi:hypothetical protein
MEEWRTYAVHKDIGFHVVRAMPQLTMRVQAEVEREWERARLCHPSLYNGAVFTADSITPDRVEGHWTEFKRVVAQMRAPSLVRQIALRPVSVCGILLCWPEANIGQECQRSVTFGRRAAGSLFQPGLWQIAPGGSLDRSSLNASGQPDWRMQIIAELREEIGVPEEAITSANPICMVEYPEIHAVELGIALYCRYSDPGVIACHRREGNGEYEELMQVPLDKVGDVLASRANELSPSTSHILTSLPKLRGGRVDDGEGMR